MGSPIDYIYENELQAQPSFRGALNVSGRFGYRGDLRIESDSKELLKHLLLVTDKESTLFLAAELENFDNFEKLFTTYKSILNVESSIILFVNNLMSDAIFEYEGFTINAFALDESSVWNELLSITELDKRELKKMSAEDKLDTMYDGVKASTLYASKKSYDEVCASKMG